MVAADILVFDMDGVLVDVTESYRETIVQTVRRFTGATIPRESIQEYKNSGGWNNDFALAQRIVRDLGVDADYETVVAEFNKIFLGHDGVEGLVARERWIARPQMLEGLAERFGLAIFTGRLRYEVDITLNRFGRGLRFDPIVCAEDVVEPKPSPEGLLAIAKHFSGRRLLYFGDVVDDARAARAAGVPFIGVGAQGAQLRNEGAIAIIDDINQIEDVLG
jgi:HAD superfamily hydrolase (TIGR01548 family)